MEYSAVGQLDCPAGNLYFNDQGRGDWFFLTGPNDPSGSVSTEGFDFAEMRTSQINRSEADGLIVKPTFLGGVHGTLGGRILASSVSDRNSKEDTVKEMFGSLLRADGNLRMTPTGGDERYLTIRMDTPILIAQVDGLVHSVGVGLVSSAQPFWRLYGEGTTTVASGSAGTVAVAGNAPAWSVYRVYGATSCTNFTLTMTWPDSTVWHLEWHDVDSFGLGSSDYIEIITYAGTMYVNGDGDDALGGLETDFDMPPLLPGNNTVALSGNFGHVEVFPMSSWF